MKVRRFWIALVMACGLGHPAAALDIMTGDGFLIAMSQDEAAKTGARRYIIGTMETLIVLNEVLYAEGAPLFCLPGRPGQPLPYLGYAPGAYLGRVADLILKDAGTAIHLDRVYETDMAEGLKVMAMEGHFKNYPDGAPLVLFGWPDQAAGEMKYSVEIPKASSLILKHSLDAPLKGLDTVPRENWPKVGLVFWSFRIMVGIGFLILLGIGIWSLVRTILSLVSAQKREAMKDPETLFI